MSSSLVRVRKTVKSLVDLCAETLAKNIGEASIEALECLPTAILWRVYQFYCCECSETLHAWRLFCPLLVKELTRVPVGLYWFRWNERQPTTDDLPRYLKLSTSPGVDFITHLTIHQIWMFRPSDLMALADMPNLAILELSDSITEDPTAELDPGDSALNDRLVRGWSEKDRPFPNLRMLMITSVSVTLLTLKYASRFPSLVYCNLRSILSSLPRNVREAKKQAKVLGWRLGPTFRPWDPWAGTGGWLWNFRHPVPQSLAQSFKGQQLGAFERTPEGGVFLSRYNTDANGQAPYQACPDTEDSESYFDVHIFQQSPLWFMWNLYSALGEQVGNADLLHQGVDLPYRASHMARRLSCESGPRDAFEELDTWARQEIFPPKPMLTLMLGAPERNYDNLGETVSWNTDIIRNFGNPDFSSWKGRTGRLKEYVFVRDYSPSMSNSASTGEANDAEPVEEGGPSKRKASGKANTFRPRRKLDMNELFTYGADKGAGV